MGDPIRERWVSEAAVGRTFAEVGGLWGTVNEQVTVAALAGATATTMIDVAPEEPKGDSLWDRFRNRAAELGVQNTTCVQGSIDDAALPGRVGSFDVVSCSGVLYHCPEPLHTLRQLRAITRETLILGTVTMPETISSSAGTISAEPGSAMLIPGLTQSQLAIFGAWLRELGEIEALGVTCPVTSDWDTEDYGAWWWFFTRDYVAALLRVAGFKVETLASYWEGRATLFLAKVPR